MSKFVQLKTELRELALIKQALTDQNIAYQENAQYVHPFGGFRGELPIVIKQSGLQFGLRLTADERYEIVGDDMQLAQIRAVMAPVLQRYAYHKVLAETEKAGFTLVEETTGRDKVIRLTVRRWQ